MKFLKTLVAVLIIGVALYIAGALALVWFVTPVG